MSDYSPSEVSESFSKLSVIEVVHPLKNNNVPLHECEDALTTDSEDCLSVSLRYRNFQCSTTSDATVVPQNATLEPNGNLNFNNIQIPIVGYEIMEERARFTVYKLRIENKDTGDCWYVFRRYTDFVRLCTKIKLDYPRVAQLLPRKRWLKNNFDPLFLEDRVSGLQTLVNAVLSEPELVMAQEIQDFFCLNEPPICLETNEESRAMLEALEETINDLKLQLRERDVMIDSLQDAVHSKTLENDNLQKIMKNSTMNCQKCQKECENFTKVIK